MEKEIQRKNVIWNIIGATANAFNSLFFTIIVTRINGTFDAGIFSYSFATACMLYIVGVYAGRTFQVTDISKENSDTDYIYNRIITCIIMIIVSILFVIIKGYEIYKSIIFVLLCFFKCSEAFAEVLYGVLQKDGKLYKVGISMFVKAVIALVLFLIIDAITKNLMVACTSILIVNILIMIIYDYKNIKKVNLIKTKYSNKVNIRLFKAGFYTFILTFLGIYLINAPRYAIDDILTSDMQTIFGIIIMPATFMGLLGQYIIQPCLTKISENIKNENYNKLKNIVKILTLIILIFGIIVTIAAWLLEVPVLELVYGIHLSSYFESIMIIIIASILYSLSTILSAILIAMRKTLYQVVVYIITAVIVTISAYNLVNIIQIKGAAITYFITMLIVSLAFAIYTIINMKRYKRNWGILNENINNNSNI